MLPVVNGADLEALTAMDHPGHQPSDVREELSYAGTVADTCIDELSSIAGAPVQLFRLIQVVDGVDVSPPRMGASVTGTAM